MEAIRVKLSGKVALNDDYSVDFSAPIDYASRPNATAYAATRTGAGSRIAYLLDGKVHPRYTHLKVFRTSNVQTLVRPQASFPVMVGNEPTWRLLIITDAFQGVPLPLHKDGKVLRYREDAILELLVNPAIRTLKEFESKGMSYRNLRPSNLWFANDVLTFGEWYTAPGGYHQPAVFEPLASSPADPLYRGDGGMAHDLHALGVCVLSMATGVDFEAPARQAALQKARLETNTTTALLADYRLPERLQELLKGVLADNVLQRWTLNEVLRWAEGQKIPNRQQPPMRKPSRPFNFLDEDYNSINLVADIMGRHSQKAHDRIFSTDMENWLGRSHGLPQRYERLKSAQSSASRAEQKYLAPAQTGYALTALFPGGPLYYQNMVLTPDALGPILEHYHHDGEMRALVQQILRSQLALYWLEQRPSLPPNLVKYRNIYEKLAIAVVKPQFGYGIERALYELSPDCPCFSPLLSKQYINSPAAVLPALESLATSQGNHKLSPIDRHLAAYLAIRTGKVSDLTLFNLSDKENPGKVAIGASQVLAMLEEKYGGGPYPNVCKWLITLLQPAIDLYHSRRRQDAVREQLIRSEKHKSIQHIHAAIDDPDAQNIDKDEFERAVAYFQRTEEALERWHKDHNQLDAMAANAARRYAPLVSGGLSGLTLLIGLMLRGGS